MCGILGCFALHTREALDPRRLQPGLQQLRRRGPDGQGIHAGPGLLLGHRRLAILDRQGGAQPWVDARTGDALTYNGELYNQDATRAALARDGQAFRTRCDTEALFAALQHQGTTALPGFDGMYAFAYYAAGEDALWLVRDPFGIKPLYYTCAGGTLYFASSVAALLSFPEVPRTLDLAATSHYLSTIRTTLGARTLLAGVHSVEPGHVLIFRRGREAPQVQRFGALPALAASAKAQPPRDLLEQVRDGVRAAVKRQCSSDVPVGSFLSGGLDSSILASVLSGHRPEGYRAFGLGCTPDEASLQPGTPDERIYAEAVAEQFDLPLSTLSLDSGAFDDGWAFLIRENGQPLSTPNEVAILQLARALREHCTVVLSGEGADEIFGGYVQATFGAYDYERAQRSATLAHDHPFRRALRRLYGQDHFSCLAEHYFRLASWVPLPEKAALLSADARAALHGDEALFLHYLSFFEAHRELTPFDQYLHLHARHNLEGLLQRFDSSTMAASVEGRVPFTDPALAQQLFALPDTLKMHWRTPGARAAATDLNVAEIDARGLVETKVLLRQAFRGDLPAFVLERPKASFPVPFQTWLASADSAAARAVLLHGPLAQGLCAPEALQQLTTYPEHGHNARILWPLLNLHRWMEQWSIELPGSCANPRSIPASAEETVVLSPQHAA